MCVKEVLTLLLVPLPYSTGNELRFDVLTAVNMCNVIHWVVTPPTLKMEVARPSETLVTIYRVAWHHKLEHRNVQKRLFHSARFRPRRLRMWWLWWLKSITSQNWRKVVAVGAELYWRPWTVSQVILFQCLRAVQLTRKCCEPPCSATGLPIWLT